MQLLDLTLDSPAENLALDEALLLAAESGELKTEVLRIWEPREFMVVLGSSSRIAEEVREETCRQRRIEVLRRSSGGAAIIGGPGCLMYALVLDRSRAELHGIDTMHRFVLDRLIAALDPLAPGVVRRGTCDLALAERKFSGNALRVRRDWLLYHGTLLYSFPLRLIEACLGTPARQPVYRAGRRHIGFVRNLPLAASAIRAALVKAFAAEELLGQWPEELTRHLAADKFSNPGWTRRL
jgi:lipoate-protein ligase A